jgi:cellulose synthase/poly-beta-1,6-N-acetylglucosamine synthase-like glycosyltransferase
MFEITVESLFIISVGLIWFMIAYQLLLTIFGCIHFLSSEKEKKKIDLMLKEGKINLPFVSILVPAHNEEKVIEGTVRHILSLDYPHDKMELLVANDSSTDKTGEILEQLKEEYKGLLQVLHIPTGEGGKGKSHVLNTALKYVKGEVIAVYDADNQPETDALKYIAANLVLYPYLGAAEGMFRCRNKNTNLLTRFINVEGVAFQWIVQSGRWKLLGLSTLPGTNFVIKRDIIDSIGGWDEKALTEDSELSVRVYQTGKRIKFIPYSVSWEQEPPKLSTWFRQRTRWVRGNNYVLWKFLRSIFRFKSKASALEMLYNLSLYYIFFCAVIFSDVIFLLGIADIWHITLLGPFSEVWLMGYILFIMEVFLGLSLQKEDSPMNFILVILSYFTYCQCWLIVVFAAIWQDLSGSAQVWQKTERF